MCILHMNKNSLAILIAILKVESRVCIIDLSEDFKKNK